MQSEDSAATFFFHIYRRRFDQGALCPLLSNVFFRSLFFSFIFSLHQPTLLPWLFRQSNQRTADTQIYPLTEPLNWAFISFIPASNGYEKDIRVSITLLSNVFAALSVHSCSNNTTTGGAAVPNWETWGEHPARTPCPLYRSLKTPDYC